MARSCVEADSDGQSSAPIWLVAAVTMQAYPGPRSIGQSEKLMALKIVCCSICGRSAQYQLNSHNSPAALPVRFAAAVGVLDWVRNKLFEQT